MRTASGLVLVAVGAILTFAVTYSPSFLNLQVAGWVLMVVGAIGVALPRRGYGWLRHRVVVRQSDPPPPGGAAPGRRFPGRPGSLMVPVPPESRPPTFAGSAAAREEGNPYPAEETVEEFREE